MEVAFVKMHGCGNDFVVIDERAGSFGLSPARAAAIADRRLGIGCDQLISLERASGGGADVFMRIRNPDGSEAGACGNATRCVAMLLGAETRRDHLTIRTIAGDLASDVLGDAWIRVDMGPARLDWTEIPLAGPADTLHLDLEEGPVSNPAALSMGNPHATFFVEDVERIPVERVGPVLECAPLFPQRANVGFAEMRGREAMRLRVWERGAGLTLACGSGACAAWVNAARRGLAERCGVVEVDGGTLEIEWRDDGHVLMSGAAAVAYRGTIDLAALPA